MPLRPGNSTTPSLVIGLLVCAFSAQLPRCSAESEAAAAVTAPSSSEIEKLISQLDDDQFDIRQRAQKQLELAELPALDAVADTAQSGSLESSTRAINILLLWSEAENQTIQVAALEKLANLRNRPRESAMAARLLANAREKAAIKRLTDLGAEVKPDSSQTFFRVRIGPNWKGGNEGLKYLADVKHSYLVQLHVAPLTDPALEHLATLTQLQRLELFSIDFSDEAVQKLQDQLPTTHIELRSGPMLGISGNPNDNIKTSVGVGGVVKGGAADRAGIRRNDRITEFNGEPVHLFTDLTDRIAKYKARDTVKLTILRQGKTQEVSVTFDHWGEHDNSNWVDRPMPQIIQRLPLQQNQPRQRR